MKKHFVLVGEVICYSDFMSKYVAMLRGIGPTNPNMKGEKLKTLFEELGFANVQTVLASGNVIFKSPDSNTNLMAERIEKALTQKLGFSSRAIIRSQAEIQKLIDRDPFKGLAHNKETYLLVTFFRRKPNIAFKLPYRPDNKPYTLIGRIDNAVYGSISLTTGKTPDYMSWLEKQFGKNITSRTPKTIQLVLSRMDNI